MRTAGASLPGRLGASLLAVILCALMVMPAQAITANTHFTPAVPVPEKTAYRGVFGAEAQAYTGLFCQGNPINGSDPSGRAAYFVERNLNITAGSLGWELGFGHGYLLFTSTSDPGTGDPFDTHQPILDTFSWHPNVWDYDRDAWPGVPGRLWEMHPTDTTPGSQHKALLLTTDASQQSSLRSYIDGWIALANPGRDYGNPIPGKDPNDPQNDIGKPHIPAPRGGVYYSLGGQNCVWWATTMIMQSNIKVPQSVYTAITKYNHGIGNADVEIGLGLSDSAFDVGTLSGIPLGVKMANLPGYDFSGFDTGL